MDASSELTQLVYVSTASHPFSPDELRELLSRSRINNQAVGVSGMLLYHDGNFIQAIEGPRDAVSAIQARIARDPRHYGMIVLRKGPIDDRNFPEWSMGFVDASSVEARPAGFSSFLLDGDLSAALAREPKAAHKLLQSFRDTMRR